MEKNRKILNEAFFGKEKDTHYDKLLKSLPQYSAVDANGEAVYQVNDTEEMKKRLAGTFGVTFGNNSIKSLASKAVKTFPIIISDAVEVETGVILKKLMEEQYAEYINMLVSNQVIDLSSYSTSEKDGNIAIQALDSISGTDFSKSRVADAAARTGRLAADDVFKNIPLYQLLREQNNVLVSGDSTMDALLENAIVVKNDEDAEKVVSFLTEALDEARTWSFASPSTVNMTDRERQREIERLEKQIRDIKGEKDYKDTTKKFYGTVSGKGPENFSFYKKDNQISGVTIARNIDAIIGQINTALDYTYLKEPTLNEVTTPSTSASDTSSTSDSGVTTDAKPNIDTDHTQGSPVLTLLTSPDAILGSERNFNSVMNRSVGEMLLDPRNEKIRDRFEKATFLLQSRRIAGIEYYNYLTMRLGIPVSDAARTKLVTQFRIRDVHSMQPDYHEYGTKRGPKNQYTDGFRIRGDEIDAIAGNRHLVEPIVNNICNHTFRHIVSAVGGGTLVGGTAALIALAVASPLVWPIAAGAAGVGAAGGFLISTIAAAREKRKLRRVAGKIEGWERVEALIDAMEKSQEAVRGLDKPEDDGTRTIKDIVSKDPTSLKSNPKPENTTNRLLNSDEFKKYYQDIVASYQSMIKEAVDTNESNEKVAYNDFLNIVNEQCEDSIDLFAPTVVELLESDENMKSTLFEEVVLNEFGKNRGTFTTPIQTRYIEKKPGKTSLVIPAYMSRTQYAYGSTEIERKDIKDRKYNQPLIMTVKFKERFSDGKLSDNQLTAVIGILGKVIRVPSAEMEEILKQNANGSTISGFFKDGKGDLANTITDMIGKAKKDASNKNLSKSGEIWHNLEKVASLAAANTMAGRKSNNIANAHIVFAQKEIDDIRNELGIDYLKDTKYAADLMRRYSAFTLMVANDAGQRVYILDDKDNISWDAVPYSAIRGKEGGDSLDAALAKLSRL